MQDIQLPNLHPVSHRLKFYVNGFHFIRAIKCLAPCAYLPTMLPLYIYKYVGGETVVMHDRNFYKDIWYIFNMAIKRVFFVNIRFRN